MENTCLYHSGVKGMRWGVRKYQNKDGSLTPAGRKRYAKAGASNSKGTAKNQPKAVTKVKTKTEETKPKELTVEEKKAKVLASRSAKELYENRHLFDYNEMTNAYNLLQRDKQIKDMIVHEPNKVEKFFDNTVIPWATRVKDIVDPASTVIKKLREVRDAIDTGDEERKAAKENAEIELKRAAAKKTDAERKKTDAETDRIKSGKEDDRNKANADADKVRAETETEKARTREAQANANRAEARGKFYRSVKKTDAENKTDTPDTTSAEPETKTDTSGTSKTKSYKAVYGKYYTSTKKASNTSAESVSGEVLDKVRSIGTTSSQTRDKKKTTYYDVDYVDHTPSRQTTSFVASLSGSTVAALPGPSSQAQSFVAGLLPGA